MQVAAGPARYFFLRHARAAHEDVPNWPPEIKPMQIPDNQVCLAVYLYPEEQGWRAVGMKEETTSRPDADGAFVLTRDTTLGLISGSAPSGLSLTLLGVRVAQQEGGSESEYATHLVVRSSGGFGVSRHPLVVPIDRMVLGAYVESGNRAEAVLDLRMTPGELAEVPAYMPDALVERNAMRALNLAIIAPRARHEIKPEVEAGRVSLYGKAEITSTGEQARAELERTPGVVEVADHLLYEELLKDQVERAMAEKGLGYINVLHEHGLIVLSGTVPDNATLHKAHDIALRIPGVRGVVTNNLLIEPAAPPPQTQPEPEASPTRSEKAQARP
jgi:hypothetical protein